MTAFPPLPENLEPTRATVHAYSHAISAVPRAYAEQHPKWWHASLKVEGDGFRSDPVPVSEGSLTYRMDLRNHLAVVEHSNGDRKEFPLAEGLTGTELADALLEVTAAYGMRGDDVNRAKFESDEPRSYDQAVASSLADLYGRVNEVFEGHRRHLEGDVGIVQLWPHNFDLALEWFGTRVETYEEGGETVEYPSQINLGFYIAREADGLPVDGYFYSNPWPFARDELVRHSLPHGAAWHTEGWEGTILYYESLAGDPDGPTKLSEYAQAVHSLAAPTLMA